jgi:hypothetical protein
MYTRYKVPAAVRYSPLGPTTVKVGTAFSASSRRWYAAGCLIAAPPCRRKSDLGWAISSRGGRSRKRTRVLEAAREGAPHLVTVVHAPSDICMRRLSATGAPF